MREQTLEKLQSGDTFDLLVIGGGATGCGIALDAATRGLKTALIERYDFAEGTSSRSTKLVHGGVRYLEAAIKRLDKAQYNLVREALHERGALLRNAPHLSNRLPLVTPLYSWLQVPYVFIGLKLYDLLSGRMNIGHSRLISRKEALRRFPMLKADGLKAGVIYYDGQFTDARMALSLVMTAQREGALLANHVEATTLLHAPDGRIAGATVKDSLTGRQWDIHARAVINATGPFADGVRRMEDPSAPPILKVSSGIHIVLDKRFVPPKTGLLIPRTDDGRVLFILPWQGHALIGTTDEEAKITDHPRPSPADIAYLLDYVRRYFNMDASEKDVLSAWAGIRPLVFDPKAGDTSRLARDHVIIESNSGLVTIAGGKWTTYRLMSEQAIDRAIATARLTHARPCRTHDMPLWGADKYDPLGDAALARDFALDADVADHLNHAYGDQAPVVAALTTGGWATRLHPAHPFLEAEVVYAVRREQAIRAADVLIRRMTLALVDRQAAIHAAPRILAIMASELGWDSARRASEKALLDQRLAEAL
ncbi:FAD-dependent oxidoreductase [Telmatospirillum siberiense]|uniref:Glycerol-3-phosphate dehydrogenase n=1 Tax=Telmatospirillum siberiense TaxID=382514 RepID=A0A2N3PZB9_9PROT|nr:FAD-dependent oxidoreductase [Telmatospirillum siberiense]PKU25756.1 glycerol-3-phosphate dehydrogenase [Telmatospirillum siberiense]